MRIIIALLIKWGASRMKNLLVDHYLCYMCMCVHECRCYGEKRRKSGESTVEYHHSCAIKSQWKDKKVANSTTSVIIKIIRMVIIECFLLTLSYPSFTFVRCNLI